MLQKLQFFVCFNYYVPTLIIIHPFMAVFYMSLCLLSINRGKILWPVVCWCMCSCPLFGVERCPLVGGWFCIVALGNKVGARTPVRY